MKKLVPAIAAICLTFATARAQIPQQLNYQGRVAVGGVNFTGSGQFKFALVDAGVNLNQTAQGAPIISNGEILGVSVFQQGSGYVTAPAVTFEGTGTGAVGTAVVTNGAVTGINIANSGSGYAAVTVVTIAPPPPNFEHQTYWSNAGDLAPGEVPSTFVTLPVTGGLYSTRLGDPALGMATFNPNIFYTPLFLRVWFNDGTNGFQQLSPDQPLASAPYALQARLAETVPNGSIGSFQLANGAVTSFKLADGAVGSNKLAAGAVSGASLAAGAVAADKLADGAVTSGKLAAAAVTPAILAPGAAAANLNAGANQDVTLGSGNFSSLAVSATALISNNLNVLNDVNVTADLRAGTVSSTLDTTVGRNLTVADSITYVGTITDLSDARLKDLGAPFDPGLDAIARIEPLHYRFKQDNALGIPGDAAHVGVSAQALRAALPEAVVERSDGYLAVNQEPVIWALVNAVKELKAENDALKKRLETLETNRP